MVATRCGRQFLGSVLIAASTTVLAAGSVDAGGSLYNSHCLQCHGQPSANSSPFLAADNPSRIRDAINPLSMMRFLTFLTEQDLLDIATYIARPNTNDTDRLLDWAEQDLLELFLGQASTASQFGSGYRFRYYPRPGIYLGTKDGNIYSLSVATDQLSLIGSVRQYLAELPKGR